MTNEEIVLSKLNNNRFLGNKPIHFATYNNGYWWNERDKQRYFDRFNRTIEELKSKTTVFDRVKNITEIRDYQTVHENNRYQCHAGARRSTCDIWRIYKYYFGEIDIFYIMRALYELVVKGDLNTYRCPNVRKRVFWYAEYREKDLNVKAELGVPLSEWKNIGLINEAKEIS